VAEVSIELTNTTGSSIVLEQLGDSIPASGSILITDSNRLWQVMGDPQLQALIGSGSIVVGTAGTQLSDPGAKTSAQSNAIIQNLHDLDIKHNLSATVAPTGGDDENAGYAVGSLWMVNGPGGRDMYWCVRETAGSAEWIQVSTFFRYSVGPDGSNAVFRDENTGGTAIQSAIDAAFAGGGGIVPILPGSYSGAIFLRAGVALAGISEEPQFTTPAVNILGGALFLPAAFEGSSMVNLRVTGGLTIGGAGPGFFRATRCRFVSAGGDAVEVSQTSVIEGITSTVIFDDCEIFSTSGSSSVSAMTINTTGQVRCINNCTVERTNALGQLVPSFQGIQIAFGQLDFQDSRLVGLLNTLPAGPGVPGTGVLRAFSSYFLGGSSAGSLSALTFGGTGGTSRVEDCAIESLHTPAISITDALDIPAVAGLTFPSGDSAGVGVGDPPGGDFRDFKIDRQGWNYVTQFFLLAKANEARQRGVAAMTQASGSFASPGDNQYFREVLRAVVAPSGSGSSTASLLNDGAEPFIIEPGKQYSWELFVQGLDTANFPGPNSVTFRQTGICYRRPGSPAAIATFTTSIIDSTGTPSLLLLPPLVVSIGPDDYWDVRVTNASLSTGYNCNARLHVIEIPGVLPEA